MSFSRQANLSLPETGSLSQKPAHPAGLIHSMPRSALNLLSLLLGCGFTILLFMLVGGLGRREAPAPVEDMESLMQVSMPSPPPPTPLTQPAPEPAQTSEVMPLAVRGISEASAEPSDSPVKEVVIPIGIPSPLQTNRQAPSAQIQTGGFVGAFKPSLDTGNMSQHVYQQNQVDRVPTVFTRRIPYINNYIRDDASELHATFLLIVNANGLPTSIRLSHGSGNKAFDKLLLDAMADWTFTPAMKDGRNVRCVLSQRINFVWRGGSRFEISQ